MSGSPHDRPPLREELGDPAVAHAPAATRLAICSRPRAPLATHDLERWLNRLVDELRAESSQLDPHLSRLTQTGLSDDSEQGWLLELELPSELGRHGAQRVTDALTDMRLLGLVTTLLAPYQLSRPEAHRRDNTTPTTGRS